MSEATVPTKTERHVLLTVVIVCIAQFGIGVFSIAQFTIAGVALAQFAFAYSLIAQVGLYLAEGHGQLVFSLPRLFGLSLPN